VWRRAGPFLILYVLERAKTISTPMGADWSYNPPDNPEGYPMTTWLVVVLLALIAFGGFWRVKENRARANAKGRPPEASGSGRSVPRSQTSVSNAPQRPPKAAIAAKVPEATPAPIVSSELTRSSRRSDRVLIRIPLQLSGHDLAGNTFVERAHTMTVNRNGGSLVIRNSLLPEEQITVKNLQTGQVCKCRVHRAAKDLPGGLREWAIECLDPAPNFWNISFPESSEKPRAEEDISCLLECGVCHYREMTRVNLSEYRTIVENSSSERNCVWCGKKTDWKFALIEEVPELTADSDEPAWELAVGLAAGAELRREDRRAVPLPISIRHEDGRAETTVTEDVSRSGVSCVADMNLSVGDHVVIKIGPHEGSGEAEFRAQIVWRREVNKTRKMLYGMKLGPAHREL
jgi:hypothetical protein